jgi:5'(3')-deoxyribonucleotidase
MSNMDVKQFDTSIRALVPIGIDIDGVLGEQVPHVLDRLHRRGVGIGISKDKITSWNFPIDNTSISKEI